MAKRKPRVTLPAHGDTGPNTEAQREGATVVTYREGNGAEFRRKYRQHALDIMSAAGKISTRQREAGLELHRRYCMTELSPESAFSRVVVDSSPRPDDVSVMRAERVEHLAELSKHIPRGCKNVVWHVAIKGKLLRDKNDTFSRDGKDASSHTAMLQVALDILANALRL